MINVKDELKKLSHKYDVTYDEAVRIFTKYYNRWRWQKKFGFDDDFIVKNCLEEVEIDLKYGMI